MVLGFWIPCYLPSCLLPLVSASPFSAAVCNCSCCCWTREKSSVLTHMWNMPIMIFGSTLSVTEVKKFRDRTVSLKKYEWAWWDEKITDHIRKNQEKYSTAWPNNKDHFVFYISKATEGQMCTKQHQLLTGDVWNVIVSVLSERKRMNSYYLGG